MDAWKLRALSLLAGIAISYKPDPAVIPYHPAKTVIPKRERPYFPRVAPESVGLNCDTLADLLLTLEHEPTVNLHNLLILKDKKVVVSASAPGYDVTIPHLAHSMSKTVTGMAIGLLADRNLIDIDAPVTAFFPEYRFSDKRGEQMRLWHLLAMRSGVSLAEVGSVTEASWAEAFFRACLDFTPGEAFAYNSMNSYILGRIAERVSGTDLFSFVDTHIFRPLGITGAFWERGPEGFVKGGWGLYLSADAWARIGQMLLDHGRFADRQILSRQWVDQMITPHSDAPASMGDFHYGYHIWVGRDKREILLNGMLGQNVWILPERQIVVVMQAGNNELFSESAAFGILRRFLGKDGTPSIAPRTRRRLRTAENAFYVSRTVKPQRRPLALSLLAPFVRTAPALEEWHTLLGAYDFCRNNASVLPLFVRVMQNNYTGGIDRLTLTTSGRSLYLCLTEGGVVYQFEVGLYEYRQTVLRIRSEQYLVRALGAPRRDADGERVFDVHLVYPELPNTRTFTLSLIGEGELRMQLSEMPNHRIAESFFSSFKAQGARAELLLKLIERRLGENFLRRRLEESFCPTLIGAKCGTTAYDAVRQREKAILEERLGESAFLEELLERYTEGRDLDDLPKEWGLMQHLRTILRLGKKPKKEPSVPQNSPSSHDASLPLTEGNPSDDRG